MKVYCCFSLYNLYIAVAKAMVQNEKIDLDDRFSDARLQK